MKVLSLALLGLVALPGPALAWKSEDAKFAMHRKDVPGQWSTICSSYSPVGEGLPCGQFTTVGPAPGASLIYFVVGLAPDVGLDKAMMGIDYQGRSGQGTGIDPDENAFTLCGEGYAYTFDGGLGLFPAPKGGMLAVWTACQAQTIGEWGVHVVIGALEIQVYSEDVLELTTNDQWEPSPQLAIHTCDGIHTALIAGHHQTVATLHLGGDGSPGTNPCAGVVATNAHPSTWGRIKALYEPGEGRP